MLRELSSANLSGSRSAGPSEEEHCGSGGDGGGSGGGGGGGSGAEAGAGASKHRLCRGEGASLPSDLRDDMA